MTTLAEECLNTQMTSNLNINGLNQFVRHPDTLLKRTGMEISDANIERLYLTVFYENIWAMENIRAMS